MTFETKQEVWDSLIRTTGPLPAGTTIQQSSRLFGNANIGQLALTNLQVAGQLASDQTYVILAMRCWMFFDGTNRRANYLNTTSQLFFTLVLGDKPAFQAPAWYYPSGGGVWGFDAVSSIYNLGEPTHESILKLARPIMVPVRQNFAVEAQFFANGTTNALTNLQTGAADDQKIVQFVIDGLQTRDVQ